MPIRLLHGWHLQPAPSVARYKFVDQLRLVISTCSFTAAPREHAQRPWSSSTLTPDPRAAARSDTCTALRAAQCRERRASPPRTAGSAAWSSSPGGEPLACARDPGRGEGGRLAPAGRGSRPERGEAEGLADCEGLPHRTSGTGHQQSDERAPCPEKRTVPLRNQGPFITLSGMGKGASSLGPLRQRAGRARTQQPRPWKRPA